MRCIFPLMDAVAEAENGEEEQTKGLSVCRPTCSCETSKVERNDQKYGLISRGMLKHLFSQSVLWVLHRKLSCRV